MKLKLFLLLCGLYAFSANALFIQGLEDVPVLEGMEQVEKDNLSFGNEESRFVEAYLTSKKASYRKIGIFYKETLPQMGWTYQGQRGETLVFEREGEILEISRETEKPLLVRIMVRSKM